MALFNNEVTAKARKQGEFHHHPFTEPNLKAALHPGFNGGSSHFNIFFNAHPPKYDNLIFEIR
jgi:hypothetical protein